MSSKLIDELVKELSEKIGDRIFLSLPELVSLGLFGTVQTARYAVEEGKLPFIRISERRCVIPSAALLDYIRNNLNCIEEKRKFNWQP
jgi:hypothetical protein